MAGLDLAYSLGVALAAGLAGAWLGAALAERSQRRQFHLQMRLRMVQVIAELESQTRMALGSKEGSSELFEGARESYYQLAAMARAFGNMGLQDAIIEFRTQVLRGHRERGLSGPAGIEATDRTIGKIWQELLDG